jgi:CAAX protease family protein
LTVAGLFLDSTGATRRPWRLAVFIFASIVATVALQGMLGSLLSPLTAAISTSAGAGIAMRDWIPLAGILIGQWITFRTVDHRSWKAIALDRSAARPRTIGLGLLLGAVAIAIPSLGLVALGWLKAVPSGAGSSLLVALAMLVALAPAALTEELVTRGYIFVLLREVAGAPVALVLTSVGFGLLHLLNAGATAISVSLVTFAGVYLGAILLLTRSLWAAWAAHLGWNWALAGVLHAAVSGAGFPTPDYRVIDAGPDWLTGGAWGPEGGAAAGLGMLGGLAYLYVRRLRRQEH